MPQRKRSGILQASIVMQVRVNGTDVVLEDSTSVAGLLERLKVKPKAIVLEHNGAILLPDKWGETILQEKDKVEIVSFVGGG